METIINFVSSENYYLALYIFAMTLCFFILIRWTKSNKLSWELLKYIKLLEAKIIKFNDGVNPYLEGKPLSYLIDHLIGTIKANIKYMGDKQKELDDYKEKMKIELDKLNQKIYDRDKTMEAIKKRDRRHIGTLYSQLAYRNKLLLGYGVKLKNKKSKYC